MHCFDWSNDQRVLTISLQSSSNHGNARVDWYNMSWSNLVDPNSDDEDDEGDPMHRRRPPRPGRDWNVHLRIATSVANAKKARNVRIDAWTGMTCEAAGNCTMHGVGACIDDGNTILVEPNEPTMLKLRELSSKEEDACAGEIFSPSIGFLAELCYDGRKLVLTPSTALMVSSMQITRLRHEVYAPRANCGGCNMRIDMPPYMPSAPPETYARAQWCWAKKDKGGKQTKRKRGTATEDAPTADEEAEAEA